MSAFFNFKSINLSGKLLSMLTQNQATITNNIANVDTPNYVKKSSNFNDVIGSMRSPVETELAKKMGPAPLLSEEEGKVNLETELINMQKNLLFYSMVTRRAGSLVNIIRSASQVGR